MGKKSSRQVAVVPWNGHGWVVGYEVGAGSAERCAVTEICLSAKWYAATDVLSEAMVRTLSEALTAMPLNSEAAA